MDDKRFYEMPEQPAQEGLNRWPSPAAGLQHREGVPFPYAAPAHGAGAPPNSGVWTHSYADHQAQQSPKPRKKRTGLKVASLVLACALAGFGGGAGAVQLLGANGTSVVYRNTDSVNTPLNVGESLTLSDVAEQAGKSVVSIVTENLVNDRFYGNQASSGAGSGVIISEDGLILTNNHVVNGASSVAVTLPDGTECAAKVLGGNAATDIAVLKIDAQGLVPAVLGNSDNLRVGAFCLAIGNPMGTLGGTVTEGIISALNRSVTIEQYEMNLLQMSAAVSPGNSGGGLFNAAGELVGVVNAKSGGENTEGLGFAVPINKAMDVAQQIIEKGFVSGGPGLGVTVVQLSAEDAAQSGYTGAGVYIYHVNRMGAAEQAGLLPGDRLVSADGAPIQTYKELAAALSAKNIGDAMQLVIERDGEQIAVEVILGELIQTT